MSTFDFEGADTEAWKPSQGLMMPEGNFVATISDPKGGRSKNGHPQIELTLENEAGATCRDWLTYGEKNGVAKVAGLYASVGVQLFNSDVDEASGMIAEAKVRQLAGRKVGIVVRAEQSYKDPSKTYNNVKGYLPAAEIRPLPGQGSAAVNTDDEIAF